MKKLFYFAASALMLMACAKTEELIVNPKENAADEGIKFEVYTQKGLSTKAGEPNDINNDNIGGIGFGVFAYYTAGEQYDNNSRPNFMYNQKVTKAGAEWTYEPIKYWPNEYGDAAQSDETDYVTFFAYAPWTKFEPTTGAAVVPDFPDYVDTDAEKKAFTENQQKKNIISVNKNTATGDPIIKYVVDTDPATSVDLLWGVAASNAAGNYSTIDKTANPVEVGFPFMNLVKPGNPKEDKLSFNLKHSLAKVKFTIDYIADDFTPSGANGKTINADETRIFVRSFTVSGWATKGALNLHNTVAGEPLWKDFDGVKDLSFNDVTFNDGRKDGKEGEENGAQTNEENQGLNPLIVENWAAPVVTSAKTKFGAAKNPGVTQEPQLLFGGNEETNGGYFYVIPRNDKPGQGSEVDVTIVYDVETIDTKLAGTLSDGETHGSTIENVISKKHILGEKLDFEAGKQYLIKIHIGMTSVKVEAVVTDWVVTNEEDVDLPDNQPMPCWTIDGVPGYFLEDPTNGVALPSDAVELVYNEETWNASYANGVLSRYYAENPSEDLWNNTDNHAPNFNDKVYTVQFFIGSPDANPVTKQFKAVWFSDEVQKIIDVDDSSVEYYLEMFYDVPAGKFELFTEPDGGVNATAAGLTPEKSCARWIKVTEASFPACTQSWAGAVGAPGSKVPWICLNYDVMPVQGQLILVYDGSEYPIFNYTELTVGYAIHSFADKIGDSDYLISNGPQKTIDPTKVQIKCKFPGTVRYHETKYCSIY